MEVINNIVSGGEAVELTITKNTTDWSSNYTKAFRAGNVVTINMYCLGNPSSKQTIATGLPIPISEASFVIGSGASVSIVKLSADGTLSILSPGVNVASYCGGMMSYICE